MIVIGYHRVLILGSGVTKIPNAKHYITLTFGSLGYQNPLTTIVAEPFSACFCVLTVGHLSCGFLL